MPEKEVQLTDVEREYLRSQHLARIATVSDSGEVDVAPVAFRLDEQDRFVIGGLNMDRSFKLHNVEANGRVAIAVDDLVSIDPWTPRGVKVHGHGEVVERPDGRKVIVTSITRKWSWGPLESRTPAQDTVPTWRKR